ncbi:MAG: hypothetical protein ACMG6S_23895 [Byssovorax sp.]
MSACFGGAVVALWFLLRTNVRIAILRMPGPVVLVTSPTTPAASTSPTTTPLSPTVLSPADAPPPADASLEDERAMLRRARIANAAGNTQATLAALNDYETRYPAGRLKANAAVLRASLLDAGAR